MPKVSVIIPVYGVEKYIERCARSLFEQTLNDIEFIFIDDCTPDKSIEVLEKVLEEYPNRREQVIIHRMEQNSGQAAVRRWGIKQASGEYIIQCDSDDWVKTDMYEMLYIRAKENKSDIVVCDFILSDGKDTNRVKQDCANSNKEVFFYDVLVKNTSSSIGNKLVKRTLFNNIIYPLYDMGEDHVILLQVAYNSSKPLKVDESFYYYYNNNNSMTKSLTEEAVIKRFNNSVGNAKVIIEFMHRYNLEVKYQNELTQLLLHKKNLIRPLIAKKGYYHLWINTFSEINGKVLFCPCVTLKEKVKFILSYIKLYKNAN